MNHRARPPLSVVAFAALLWLGGVTACVAPKQAATQPSASDRARVARTQLVDARSFRRQGRLDAARRALERGLIAQPENARIHRTLAEILDEQFDAAGAAEQRRIADRLAPPPPPLPDSPLASSRAIHAIALIPGNRPTDPAWTRTLRQRLAVRLPGATLSKFDPASVAAARRWLAANSAATLITVQLDRVDCGESLKDGRFAVTHLRVTARARGAEEEAEGHDEIRETILDPPREGCEAEVLARALERLLALPAVEAALRAQPPAASRWSRIAIRSLFPGIRERIEERLDRGLTRLSAGEVASAAESFGEAAALDPDDPTVLAFQAEANASLSLIHQLEQRRTTPSRSLGSVDPRLSESQRDALESQLEQEQGLRNDLLAALATLDEDVHAPPTAVLTILRVGEIRDPGAFGPQLARLRAGGPVEMRAVFAPDGTLLARYFLPVAESPDREHPAHPVLKEEDLDGDHRADRWIGYRAGVRTDIWEDQDAKGSPGVHLVFAAAGEPLERIELDGDRDGNPERIFYYRDGNLEREVRDLDGDGLPECTDRFSAEGDLVERLEDLDGDGEIDRRSFFRDGKLLRRELSDPDLADRAGCAIPASRKRP